MLSPKILQLKISILPFSKTLVISILLLVVIASMVLSGCTSPLLTATVDDVRSAYLKLDNGEIVQLAGVAIPWKNEPNYSQELQDNVYSLLVGKRIRYRIILKTDKDYYYPREHLVVAFMDGVNVNEFLLDEGKAFYSYDVYVSHAKGWA